MSGSMEEAHGRIAPLEPRAPRRPGWGVAAERFLAKQRLRWRTLPDLPARTALRFSNIPRISAMIEARYRARQAAHVPFAPPLRQIDQEIVAALQTDGVYVTTLGAIGLAADDVIALASVLATSFADEARRQVAAGKDFVLVPPERVAGQAAIFRWGLADRLLDIAEAYLGLPPGYDGVTLNYTVADGREVSTRKWHRDWEDRRMLKIAVYIHAVDEQGGPFEVVRPAPGGDPAEPFRYDLASDADLENLLGPEFRQRIVSCQGASGTVVFTDTARCFHRGRPATARDRYALFFSYFARLPRHPFYCERTGMSRAHIAELAQGLSDRQRGAALWRRRLPWWVRMIPRARL